MGTKKNPSEFDCYAAAEDDEPMFVLLARDPDAPDLVRLWAAKRKRREGVLSAKASEAFACAEDMETWRRDQFKKSVTIEYDPEVTEIERLTSTLHALQAHPDYEYTITTNGRKHATRTPEGDGWEVNTEHLGGWERFEYHEENYWRRRRPESAPVQDMATHMIDDHWYGQRWVKSQLEVELHQHHVMSHEAAAKNRLPLFHTHSTVDVES